MIAAVRLTPQEWVRAQQVCTAKQLEVLDYWRHDYGYKRIAVTLDLNREAVRGRIERGLSNINRTRYTHGREAA